MVYTCIENVEMEIEILWEELPDNHPAWDWQGVLYAYLHPSEEEILYIGKADGRAIRQRWDDEDKLLGFWKALQEQRGIYMHRNIFGVVSVWPDLDDPDILQYVECFLIFQEQPWGNIKCRESYTSRPGTLIRCGGDWPGEYEEYYDE